MTIPNVTFSNLSGLIAEFAPAKYAKAVNMASPLISEGVLKKEEAEDSEVLVYVLPDGLSSTSFVQDLDDLPRGVGATPDEGLARPKPLISVIRLGRSISNAKMPDAKRARFLDAHLDAGARNGARMLCRGVFGGSVSPDTGTSVAWTSSGAANATLTVNFEDISLFRVGQAVDFVDDSAGDSYVVRVESVEPASLTNSANVAGTVIFRNDVQDAAGNDQTINVTVTDSDYFALRGTYTTSSVSGGKMGTDTATGAALTSFDTIAGPSNFDQDLFGIDASATNFKGQHVSLSAAYSQEAVLGFLSQMELYSDLGPNQCVMSPKVAAAHAAAVGQHGTFAGVTGGLGGAARVEVNGSMDKYANMGKMTIRGLPITIDPNSPADRIHLFNDETLKLYTWREMGVVDDEGNGIRVLDDKYGFQVQIAGEYELVPTERLDVGIIHGITNL